jgi:hypothetical protein
MGSETVKIIQNNNKLEIVLMAETIMTVSETQVMVWEHASAVSRRWFLLQKMGTAGIKNVTWWQHVRYL